LNSVDEFGSNRASTVELDEEDGAVCVDEHARRVKRWSTDSSSNGTTTVFSGGTSAGRVSRIDVRAISSVCLIGSHGKRVFSP
jgi:hypothetical protein